MFSLLHLHNYEHDFEVLLKYEVSIFMFGMVYIWSLHVLYLLYFYFDMNCIQLITFIHCGTALVCALYVFPTAVLTKIISEVKEKWLWEGPSQSTRHCRH